jgi:epoxyqueuosine reductase
MTTTELETIAVAAGFDAVGVATAVRAPHADAFLGWLGMGFHASMDWMASEPERRCRPDLVLPGARSVIVLAMNYFTPDANGARFSPVGATSNSPGQASAPPWVLEKEKDCPEWAASQNAINIEAFSAAPLPPGGNAARGRIARYARGRDYHNLIPKRLKKFDEALAAEGGRQRCYADSGPLLERDFAVLAGIAWHGKSTMALHPKLGTWFILAAVITTLEIEAGTPMRDHCGNCTRCIDACPTSAIVATHKVDARRCLSYWTIEHEGPLPDWIRPLLGDRIFGCDDCLDACPWNRFAVASREASFAVRPASRWPLRDYLAVDEEGFRKLFEGSPIRRAGRQGFLRNVCTALGNVGTLDDLPALERCRSDTDPVVAEHAAWATERIPGLTRR